MVVNTARVESWLVGGHVVKSQCHHHLHHWLCRADNNDYMHSFYRTNSYRNDTINVH